MISDTKEVKVLGALMDYVCENPQDEEKARNFILSDEKSTTTFTSWCGIKLKRDLDMCQLLSIVPVDEKEDQPVDMWLGGDSQWPTALQVPA